MLQYISLGQTSQAQLLRSGHPEPTQEVGARRSCCTVTSWMRNATPIGCTVHQPLTQAVFLWCNRESKKGRLSGAHYQATLIAKVLEKFEIRRVGYHTRDNAFSNNTCLEALSKKLQEHEIDFDPGRSRIRCFGHVLNLCLQAFLLACSKEALHAALATTSIAPGAKSMEAFSATLNKSEFPVSHDVANYAPSQSQSQSQPRRLNKIRAAKQAEFSGWEGVAALQKLHHLAVWIRSSALHSDRWRDVMGQILASTPPRDGLHGTESSTIFSAGSPKSCSLW
ncbi:hypothetical protein BBAD15_g12314 [Beauveria bassiana D1-5]|uniref:AC9 transposase n=1 Tax=Beauveria bassiana D1-5 TaxID=1245745 RepID=A0A0A2VNQ1_BEABA|nr:hypothetical protein BBAD15_g12314 [Beauveria bassiana D1-5]